MADYALAAGTLGCGHAPLLSGLPATTTLLPDASATGAFLRFTAPAPGARLVLPAGVLADTSRFMATHRYEPYWMRAAVGSGTDAAVPVETQFLLAERVDGDYAVYVPLLDGAFSCHLQSAPDGALELVAESGDPAVTTGGVTGLYVACGDDPYALIEASARGVAARLATGRLRADKGVPAFADQFGWCTWNAFYEDVSPEGVREGLQRLADGGVPAKLLILDDGWQSVRALPTGERRLTAFAPNQKFHGDLGPVVRMAKEEFGVETFLVWHALHGYWGGVDGDAGALPGYDVRLVERAFSPGVLSYGDGPARYWGKSVGVVSNEQIYRFYHDYHRTLRAQGVDGVKVDTQSTLESVAHGSPGGEGRVGGMRAYHEALEGSVAAHFQGNLINCMSCANDMLYSALASNITRTSTDFWPDDPASHGVHLYTNAQVSLWFGEFVLPDWDMFQSGHAQGAFHAAGRALSGGPVYVSDKPGTHGFEVLRKLVLPDGTVPRCPRPGRLTRDCLFTDFTRGDALMKIFNHSGGHRPAGLLGAFNAHHGPLSDGGAEVGPSGYSPADSPGEITGAIRPGDVEGLAGERFAVYAHNAGELRVLGRDEAWEITLPHLAAEVFTIATIEDGFAAVGLTRYFNSAHPVVAHARGADGAEVVHLRAGGAFTAWCERAPEVVICDGGAAAFRYDAATGRLDVDVPAGDGLRTLHIG